jgi:acyl-ACP thioesterase
LNLGDRINPVNFSFVGLNTTKEKVKAEVKPSCGCTEVKYNSEINPGEKIEIQGVLDKPLKSNYSKSLKVTLSKQNETQEVILWVKVRII